MYIYIDNKTYNIDLTASKTSFMNGQLYVHIYKSLFNIILSSVK